MRRWILLSIALRFLAFAPSADAQWRALGLSGHEIHRLQVHGNDLYACTDLGLFRIPLASPDTVWSPAGFAGMGVLDMAVLGPETLLAAKALTPSPWDSISIFRSIGTGTWVPFQNGFGTNGNRQARRLLALEGVPGALLGVGGGGIEKSTDGGLSWRVVAQGDAVNALERSPADPQLLWAGGETAIFWPYALKSTDAGDTWTRLEMFAGGDNAVDAIAGHPVDPKVVYLGMEGRVMKSEDGGATWFTMTSPSPSSYMFGLAIRPFLPLKLYAAGASSLPDARGVVFFRSYTGGLSWSAASYSAYAGYGVKHLLLRTQGGSETLYVATYSGVYRYDEALVGVPTESGVPRLGLRAGPNPFTRNLEIEFTLFRPEPASLLMVDMRGRTVAVLEAGMRGPGPHRVSWQLKSLPAGVYVCRLVAGDYVRSVKVTHLP